MLAQIAAIAWAQIRTTRNHLPRTHAGTIVIWFVSLLWYGLYAALAVFLALTLPAIPVAEIRQWMPVALLGVFVFWQLLPLLTLSSGWSLQLNKLQIYPVSDAALFGIEVLLRITSAPEMVLVLLGGVAGLARHPQVPLICALCLLLYVPFNLFLSLAIREMFLHAFERNRMREVFAVLLIAIALIPQILARTGFWRRARPYFFAASNRRATPWHEAAMLSLGISFWISLGLFALWTAAVYALARWQFKKALTTEESFRAGTQKAGKELAPQRGSAGRFGILDRLFRDPVAAILCKEFQSLVRMPRFRVMFGMACIFGLLVFLPASMNARHHGGGFMANNFLMVVDLYGLLLLSDLLLLNMLGVDRSAAQLYFATPVPLEDVIRAKNLTAVAFVALQGAVVLAAAAVMRVPMNAVAIGEAVGASAVATVFFLAVGNLCSMAMPRPIDPRQTFRKQAGGRMQLWFFLCSLGLGVLMGFAFLARWAFQNDWALAGVLAVEFAVGLIFYHFATESAIERAMARREEILEALMKGASPVALGT
jgi:ABC-2 type transport system permease protein